MIPHSEPILSVVCNEANGPVTRKVYPLVFTIENLKKLWEKSKQHRSLMNKEISNDFTKFCNVLMYENENGQVRAKGIFWVIDDFVGVFYMTNIMDTEALVHYTFFDGAIRGRRGLTMEMIRYVFRKFGFWRLNVEIPLYANKKAIDFTCSLGFRKEGRKRKAARMYDTKFDVLTLGLIRSDILHEEDASTLALETA